MNSLGKAVIALAAVLMVGVAGMSIYERFAYPGLTETQLFLRHPLIYISAMALGFVATIIATHRDDNT